MSADTLAQDLLVIFGEFGGKLLANQPSAKWNVAWILTGW
jgi:hypothetical protein